MAAKDVVFSQSARQRIAYVILERGWGGAGRRERVTS